MGMRIVWLVAVVSALLGLIAAGLVAFSPLGIAIFFLCAACEFVDSSLGMGYGTTLTPVLLMMGFAPLDLVPAILISEFFTGIAAASFHHGAGNVDLSPRSPHGRVALLLAACSVVGVLFGVGLALSVSPRLLKTIIGLIILGAGGVILAMRDRTVRYRGGAIGLLGALASFNKAVSGGGYGPLLTSGQIVSGVEGRAAIGITSLAEGLTCFAAGLLYLAGRPQLDFSLVAVATCGALLAVPFSVQVVHRTSERRLRLVIALLTLFMGGLTLVRTWMPS